MAQNSLNQFPEAIASFQRAIDANPGFVEALHHLGGVLSRVGRLDEGIVCLQRAWQLNPRDQQVDKNLRHLLAVKERRQAAALMQQGNLAAAEPGFRRAIGLKEDYASAHNDLGALLRRLGRDDEAVASYKRALAINPRLGEARDPWADDEPLPDEEMALECMMPEMEIYHSGRIRAATLVDIPAYVEARLYLDQPVPEGTAVEADAVDMPVTASSFTMTIPDLPPAEWFAEPRDEPEIGAITITDEGRIFGYLAPKHVAHRGIRDKRVTVPMGNVDYGIWMNRVTLADDGRGGFTRIATGPITMDCGHASASPRVVGAARREHYDNSCSIVATVAPTVCGLA